MSNQTTAEIIAEQARELYHDTIYSAITANDIEQADAYTNEHLKLTVEVMDALGVFHVSDRMLVAIAQAMRWTLEDLEAQAIEEAHDRAAAALISAYAEAIGDDVTADDPEAIAAHRVARACIGLTTATDDDRATGSAMVEAIADRAREAAADPEDLEEPAPIYQRHELLAYLGDPEAYDVDAIEAEATRYTADGNRVWSAFGEDLAAIAERHQLVTYWPAI
jgi:hypothetical protein